MKTDTQTIDKKPTTQHDPHVWAQSLGIEYVGDINIEYGGVFFDPTEWAEYGYANAVRVTDLDSACGFVGGVLVERLTILRLHVESALDCIGHAQGEPLHPNVEIEACLAYGSYDPAESYYMPSSIVISTDPDSMQHDGWKAEKHIDSSDLLGFINAEWLGDF